jgi:hypothetical protein
MKVSQSRNWYVYNTPIRFKVLFGSRPSSTALYNKSTCSIYIVISNTYTDSFQCLSQVWMDWNTSSYMHNIKVRTTPIQYCQPYCCITHKSTHQNPLYSYCITNTKSLIKLLFLQQHLSTKKLNTLHNSIFWVFKNTQIAKIARGLFLFLPLEFACLKKFVTENLP